eukprot:12938497-Prorocentrum_lima.AAC.1
MTNGQRGARLCLYSTASAVIAHQGHHPAVAKYLRIWSAIRRRTVLSTITNWARYGMTAPTVFHIWLRWDSAVRVLARASQRRAM